MVLIGFIVLSLASSSAAPEATAPTPTQEEPFTLSPCPEGAGCRSAVPKETEKATWSPSVTPSFPPTEVEVATSAGGPPLEERRWYGYELILTDFASILIAGVGVAVGFGTTGCEPESNCDSGRAAALFLIGIGAVGFAIAPPFIHLAHAQYGSAAGSFALRAILPILSGLALQNSSSVGIVVALEMLGAMIVDDALLSSEPRQVTASTRIEPSAMAAPSSLALAYGGRF